MPRYLPIAIHLLPILVGCEKVEAPADIATLALASSQPVAPGPALDADASPEATRTLLKKSAAIVEVVVEGVENDFDEHVGPRTNVGVRVDSVLLGSFPEERTVLRIYGGPTNEGTVVSSSRTVSFVVGARYVLFLRNDAWFREPLLGVPLRVETFLERELLLAPSGRALTGLEPEGLRFGRGSFSSRASGSTDGTIEVTPRDVAGTIDRSRLRELLIEAVEFEGVAPSGQFQWLPRQRDSWKITPTAPSPNEAPTGPNGPSGEPSVDQPVTGSDVF